MGYELHITRAESWSDSARHPLSADEWEAFAALQPELREDGWIGYSTSARNHPVFAQICSDGSQVSLYWQGGEITVSGYPDRPTLSKLCEYAQALDAKVQGDDGEDYPDAIPAHPCNPASGGGLGSGMLAAIRRQLRRWPR
jgi:hypothetical protein